MIITQDELKGLAVKYGIHPLPGRNSRPIKQYKNMHYWDYCVEYEPVYYGNIMLKINKLANITLRDGHNSELDRLKDYLWALIGLKDK